TTVLARSNRPALLVVGSVIALIGVAVVFLPDLLASDLAGSITVTGVVLSLSGSGVIAIGTVIGRRVMPGNDPLAISALASAAAIIPVAALTATNGGFAPIFDASNEVKLALIYVGIGCTAINFGLWYYGLKHLSAAGAS